MQYTWFHFEALWTFYFGNELISFFTRQRAANGKFVFSLKNIVKVYPCVKTVKNFIYIVVSKIEVSSLQPLLKIYCTIPFRRFIKPRAR